MISSSVSGEPVAIAMHLFALVVALFIIFTTKPGLVVKIINKASNNANRCIAIATGSPLTEDEIAATKKSQINGECPSLANPNYVQ